MYTLGYIFCMVKGPVNIHGIINHIGLVKQLQLSPQDILIRVKLPLLQELKQWKNQMPVQIGSDSGRQVVVRHPASFSRNLINKKITIIQKKPLSFPLLLAPSSSSGLFVLSFEREEGETVKKMGLFRSFLCFQGSVAIRVLKLLQFVAKITLSSGIYIQNNLILKFIIFVILFCHLILNLITFVILFCHLSYIRVKIEIKTSFISLSHLIFSLIFSIKLPTFFSFVIFPLSNII